MLTTNQATQYLGETHSVKFTKSTLETWRCWGRGPRYHTLRGRVYYKPEDLDTVVLSAQPVETIDSTN